MKQMLLLKESMEDLSKVIQEKNNFFPNKITA